MQIIDFGAEQAEAITQFGSVGATSVPLGHGTGEAHAYCVRFAPGGEIGPHPTGFGQLFIVIEGQGWVMGGDGIRMPIAAGQAAFFARGEVHSKGSTAGMIVIMLQVFDLAPQTSS